jgi:glycerol kinase
MIFDESGKKIASAQKEHSQILPQPGYVEHDAAEIWRNTCSVIAEALADAGLEGRQLSAIGITNQRETIVAWDSQSSEPLAHAIVWQDVRTADDLHAINETTKKKIEHKTGLALVPYFSASKIAWLIRNNPAVAQAIRDGRARFGTIDTWILWKLTGGNSYKTDVTNASRTLLMNLETLDWDSELLEIFGLSQEFLPAIHSSSEIFGMTSASGPLAAEIPISGILGDQQAAMVGQLCFDRGDSKCTYGTGNFALVNTGNEIVRSANGLLTTVCFKMGDQPATYALEGSVAVTGSAVQWLRDQLGIIKNSNEIEPLAASVPDTGGVYFVPAFSGLFAPYWRGDARGVLVGLTRSTTKAHIARATLEAICYQTRDVMDAMAKETGTHLSTLRVDGGATLNELCMQMQADILQVKISRPEINETTALGAAYAAGLGVGIWKNFDELRSQWSESASWQPHSDSPLSTTGYLRWKKAIERTLNWVN